MRYSEAEGISVSVLVDRKKKVEKKMSSKRSGYSKGSKKRRAEDQYDLQTILDDDASNDADAVEPRAAARNAETNDESVRFRNFF